MPVRLELSASEVEDIRVVDRGREIRARNSAELREIVSRTMQALGDKIVDREYVVAQDWGISPAPA